MTTNTNNLQQIDKLRSLARQCQTYQLESGLTDAALCRKVSQVGSSKTYKKILDETDPLNELNLERQLANYESAVSYIATLRTSELPPEPEYSTFTNILESLSAVSRAMREPSIARLVVVEGENGTGKDAVKNAIHKNYPNITHIGQANALWRDNADNSRAVKIMLAGLVNAVDIRRRGENGKKFVLPTSGIGLLELLKEELKNEKTILIINEAHHLGPGGLNLIKDIINDTPVVVVLLCVPKLLHRLVNANYEEAAQLFGNRLCEHLVLPSPPVEEIAELFEKRGIKFDADKTASTSAAMLAGEAPMFGNWRYVNQVARECRLRLNGSALTIKQFDAALAIARGRRIKQSKKFLIS